MTTADDWFAELSYTEFPGELLLRGQSAGTRRYAAEIEEMLAPDGGIAASAVFCVEEQPTVCFIDASTLSQPREQRIEQIRQRVWNQNLASVVLVLDPHALAAYAVSDRNAVPDILVRGEVGRRGQWSAYEVQSGFIKDRLSEWFLPEERVDQRLLANLREVVKRLTKDALTDSQAEALMAQIIFLCYLEQRGIVGDAYRVSHGLDVLETYVSKKDGKGIDRLLKQLSADFNGDFLSSREGAPPWAGLGQHSFDVILQFLRAVDVDTGQGSFWRYDFSHIPVELISGIYETLLKDRQGALGAYYTPRHLANLVTEQSFEAFDEVSECTVYDGACGSGILLTTAFRKMLRHAEIKRGGSLRFSERVALMERAIFGNDLDETACWITAFSLYLSLLEGLAPSDISLLQTDENLKLPKLIGPGRNIQKGHVYGDFFSDQNPFAGSGRFDIFLCNPPWRESADDEKPTWEDWCLKQEPPFPIGRRQIAAGFAYRAMHSVKPGGVVTLIMPLNLVIGATKQSCCFRQRMLEEAQIQRVINFGDVRRLLFPAAKHPCAVLLAKPRPRDEAIISLSEETVEYWTPKSDVSLALGRLALHAVDRKMLSAREIYEKPYLLISAYWGERRDIDLLKRLKRLGTVGGVMQSQKTPWLSGKGFHAPNSSNPNRDLGPLQRLRFLQVDRSPNEYPLIAADVQLDRVRDHFSIVASPGGQNAALYRGPRVIFPDGLSDGYGLRAVYTDVQFAFTSSVGAIGGSKADAGLLKLLTAYLRSPLVSYLMVMTGYSVIGERPRIALDDVEAFPFCSPERHPDRKGAVKIVDTVSALFDKLATVPELERGTAYEKINDRLNGLVYDYFQLTDAERVLVEDTVQVIAKSIQPPDYERLATPLLRRVDEDEIRAYVSALATELAAWRLRNGGKGALEVRAVTDGRGGFFGAVQIKISRRRNDEVAVVTSERAFQNLLGDLHAGLRLASDQTSADDLFKIPNIMVVAGDSFFFVKPMRRRFWLERTALTDADHIVQAVHSAAWERTYQ